MPIECILNIPFTFFSPLKICFMKYVGQFLSDGRWNWTIFRFDRIVYSQNIRPYKDPF